MAKFKKKKSAPTPGNDDSKPKIEENIDIPETENSPPSTNNSKEPSKDPPISVAEKSEKDKKLAKLFWMRIALGVIAGVATTFIFEDIEGEERIAYFTFEGFGKEFILVGEFFGDGNILLCNNEMKILALHHLSLIHI